MVEDTTIELNISSILVDNDGSESLQSLTLTGLPNNAVLSDGVNEFISTGEAGSIDIAEWDLSQLTIQPTASFSGEILLEITAVSVEASTGETSSTTEVFPIDVLSVNDAVIIDENSPLIFNAIEDTQFTITEASLLSNASDIDSEQLIVTNLSIPNATYTTVIDPDTGSKSFLITLDENFNGDIDLSFNVSDQDGSVVSSNALVNVVAVNDTPTTEFTDLTGNEDNVVIITQESLLSNTVDIDGDTLTASNLSIDESFGEVFDNGDGTFSFTPSVNYNGNVPFSFSVSDGTVTTSAHGNISITSVNDLPTFSETSFVTTEDNSIVITNDLLLENAADIDSDTLSIVSVSMNDSNGTVVQNENGNWIFTPSEHFSGDAELSISINDGIDTVSFTSTVSVDAIADAPALNISLKQTVAELTEADLRGEGGLAQWSTDNSNNYNGYIEIHPDTSYGVSDNRGQVIELEAYPGDESNLYQNLGISASQTITISFDLSARAGYGGASSQVDLYFEGVLIDSILPDVGWESHAYTLTATTENPRLEFDSPSQDGLGAILDTITVVKVGVIEDQLIDLNIEAILVDDDGSESLQSLILTGLPEGVVLSDGTNDFISTGNESLVDIAEWDLSQLTIQPTASFSGEILLEITAVSVEASTGETSSTTEVFPIDVLSVNDAVIIDQNSPLIFNAIEDTQFTITEASLLSNASDIDSEQLIVTNLSIPNATYTTVIDPDTGSKSFLITLDENFNGDIDLSFNVSDQDGSVVSSNATVNVAAVNDAPVVTDGITVASFEESSPWVSLGNADVIDGEGLLVDDLPYQSGGMLYDQSFNSDEGFRTSFDIHIDPQGGASPYGVGDGTAVSFHNGTELNADNAVIGGTGGGLGAGGLSTDFLTVGFDTYNHQVVEITDANGELILEVDVSSYGGISHETDARSVEIEITPDGLLNVNMSFDDGQSFQPIVVSLNLNDAGVNIPDDIKVMYTASTGGAYAEQTISNVELSSITGTDQGTIVEDTSYLITEELLLINASDIDSVDLSVVELTLNNTDQGSLVDNQDGSWTFIPTQDFNGQVEFGYSVSDGEASTSAPPFYLQVQSINDEVVINENTPLVFNAMEDTQFTITEASLLSNASDIDSEQLIVTNLSIPNATYTTVIDPDTGSKSFLITLDENFNGDIDISFNVSDQDGSVVSSSAVVNVVAVNDAPIISNPITATGEEDNSITLSQADLLAYASDPEGDNLTASNVSVSDNAVVTDNGDGSFTLTPDADYNGDVVFTFDISDGNHSESTSGTVTFIPVTDFSAVNNQNFAINEDTSITLTKAEVLQTVSYDGEGEVEIASISTESGGTLVDNGNDTWTFTPPENFNGQLNLNVEVYDSEAVSSSSDTLTISGSDFASLDGEYIKAAQPGYASNAGLDLDYTHNDGDYAYYYKDNGDDEWTLLIKRDHDGSDNNYGDGTWMAVTTSTDPSTLTGDVENLVPSYTAVDYDYITYSDSTDDNGLVIPAETSLISYGVDYGESLTAFNVELDINAVNDAPEVTGTIDGINEDSAITLSEADILALITDVEGDSFSLSSVSYSGSDAQFTDNGDSTYTLTPNEHFNGDLELDISLLSGGQDEAIDTTLSIPVIPVNDAATNSGDINASVDEDHTITLTQEQLLANAADVDGDDLTADNLSASNVTIIDNHDGTFSLTPDENFNGIIDVAYDISDGQSTLAANLNLTVDPINDVPVIDTDIPITITEDGSYTITQAELLQFISDVEGDDITAAISFQPTETTASGSVVDSLTGDPISGATVTLFDSSGHSTTATTNVQGEYTVTGQVVENGQVSIEQPGGISSSYNIDAGSTADLGLTALSDQLDADDMRIVLTWGGSSQTKDLDSHLWLYDKETGNELDEVYFADKTHSLAGDTVNLDRDDVSYYGPETITIPNYADADLHFAVKNHTSNSWNVSGTDEVSVQVFVGDSLVQSFTPEVSGSGSYWHVFDVVDGIIVPLQENNNGYGSSDFDVVSSNEAESAENGITISDIANSDESTEQQAPEQATYLDSTDDISVNNGTIVNNGDGTYTITPDTNFFGQFSVSYTATDSSGGSCSGLINFDIASSNDAPIVENVTYTIEEDGVVNFTADYLLSEASDIEGDDLSISEVSYTGTDGVLTINPEGSDYPYTFTPNENFNGQTNIDFQVSDGIDVTDASLNVTVTAVNDTPLSASTSHTVNEDHSITLTQAQLLLNSSDVDGDDLTASNLTTTGETTITDHGDGTFTVTPDENYHGDISLSFDVSDGTGSVAGISTLTVTPVNDLVIARDDSTTTNIDEPQIRLESEPNYGSMEYHDGTNWQTMTAETEYSADTEIRFVPDSDLINSTFEVSQFGTNIDETAEFSDWGTLTDDNTLVMTDGDLTVTISTNEDDPLKVFNDELRDGRASQGTGTGLGDDDPDSETFITQDAGLSNDEMMRVDISGQDINSVSFTLDGLGGYFRESSPGANDAETHIIINAYDNDGHLLATELSSSSHDSIYTHTYSLTLDEPVAYFEIGTDNSLGTYVVQSLSVSRVPTEDITVTTIQADGTETSSTTHLEFTSENSNDAIPLTDELIAIDPDITTKPLSTSEDQPITISASDLLSNDSDIDGDTVSISAVNAIDDTHGTVSLDLNGDILFTPNADYNGEASFSYTVTDGNGSTDSATVSVQVEAVNDGPDVSGDLSSSVVEDNAIILTQDDLLANASDIEGDNLTAADLSASHATIVDNLDGTFTVTADPDFNGEIAVSFNISDGTEQVSSTLNLTVFPDNDAPVISSATSTTGTEDTSFVLTQAELLGNASDIDGDNLTASNLSGENVVIVDNLDGTYTLTPEANFHGEISLSYDISDGSDTVSSTLNLSVTAVNDTPIISEGTSATTLESDLPSTTMEQLPLVVVGGNDMELSTYLTSGDPLFDNYQVSNIKIIDFDLIDGTEPGSSAAVWLQFNSEEDRADFLSSADSLTINGFELSTDEAYTLTELSVNGLNGIQWLTNDENVTDLLQTIVASDFDQQVNITVTPNPISLLVTQDDLLANASDIDGDSLTASNLSGDNIIVVDNQDGTYTVTPEANFHGEISLSYDISDGSDTVSSTLDLTVTAVNDIPTISHPVTASMAEDNSITLSQADLLATASDIDGDSLTASNLSGENVVIVDNLDGSYTVTPEVNFHGEIHLSYDISDGSDIVSSTLDLTVTAVNDTPIISGNTSATTLESDLPSTSMEQLPLTVVGDDDMELATYLSSGDPLFDNYQISNIKVLDMHSGDGDESGVGAAVWLQFNSEEAREDFLSSADTLTINGFELSSGEAYTLTELGVNGLNGLQWLSNDDNITDLLQTIIASDFDQQFDVTVTPNPISLLITQDDLLANASDIDGNSLTASNLSGDNIIVVDNQDGTYTVTPEANFHGEISLNYDISDGSEMVSSTLDLTVTAVNDIPTISHPVTTSVAEDNSITLSQADLLATASDIDGDNLTAADLSASHATIVDNLDGTFTVTADPDFNGEIAVSFNVSDGSEQVSSTLNLTVSPDNDAPVISSATSTTGTEDTSFVLTQAELLANASDIDGDSLTASNLSSDDATLVDNLDGTFTVTPNANVNGDISISYTVSDGEECVATSMAVNLAAVNDGPDISGDLSSSVDEDNAIILTQDDLLANASDIEGDNLTAADLSASHATIVDNLDGTFTVTVDPDFNGEIAVSFNVSDGTEQVSSTLNLTVSPDNDAPVISGATSTTGTEDTSFVLTQAELLANASDIDGDSLTASNLSSDDATLVDNLDGTFTVTPNENVNGDILISYTVSDGEESVVTSMAVNLSAVNDEPNSPTFSLQGTEDQLLVIDPAYITDQISDIDGDDITLESLTVRSPANATLTQQPDGMYHLVSSQDFNGLVELDYQVSDGEATVDGTLNVDVIPVNDTPISEGNASLTTSEDGAFTFTAGDLMDLFSDIDNDDLVVSRIVIPDDEEGGRSPIIKMAAGHLHRVITLLGLLISILL
ncbi:tandem-95 repeat protein (plasmid) [Vibrio sp. SS-MA-C1-2]|nr:tandem-95 repeat protein [Vibrio sp. SS-MA-C1-2]